MELHKVYRLSNMGKRLYRKLVKVCKVQDYIVNEFMPLSTEKQLKIIWDKYMAINGKYDKEAEEELQLLKDSSNCWALFVNNTVPRVMYIMHGNSLYGW